MFPRVQQLTVFYFSPRTLVLVPSLGFQLAEPHQLNRRVLLLFEHVVHDCFARAPLHAPRQRHLTARCVLSQRWRALVGWPYFRQA
jgi:hypothetical protein